MCSSKGTAPQRWESLISEPLRGGNLKLNFRLSLHHGQPSQHLLSFLLLTVNFLDYVIHSLWCLYPVALAVDVVFESDLLSAALKQKYQNTASVQIATSRVQRISDLHSKFALRPHHVPKYGKHPISGR